MNYLTKYYKNLSEQLQQQVDILEANLIAPYEMRELERNPNSDRAFKREEIIDAIRGLLTDGRANPNKVSRVLHDAMGHPGPRASREDIQHVMAHIRGDYYIGSEDPQEQKLDAARQRTLDRYG
jgi:hypothetical protein